MMVNISNGSLSDNEISPLSRGLSFCPRPPCIDRFKVKENIKQISWRIRLREFFYNPETTNNERVQNPFRWKSKWTHLTNRELTLETYITSVRREIDRTLDPGPSNRSRYNLSSLER